MKQNWKTQVKSESGSVCTWSRQGGMSYGLQSMCRSVAACITTTILMRCSSLDGHACACNSQGWMKVRHFIRCPPPRGSAVSLGLHLECIGTKHQSGRACNYPRHHLVNKPRKQIDPSAAELRGRSSISQIMAQIAELKKRRLQDYGFHLEYRTRWYVHQRVLLLCRPRI